MPAPRLARARARPVAYPQSPVSESSDVSGSRPLGTEHGPLWPCLWLCSRLCATPQQGCLCRAHDARGRDESPRQDAPRTRARSCSSVFGPGTPPVGPLQTIRTTRTNTRFISGSFLLVASVHRVPGTYLPSRSRRRCAPRPPWRPRQPISPARASREPRKPRARCLKTALLLSPHVKAVVFVPQPLLKRLVESHVLRAYSCWRISRSSTRAAALRQLLANCSLLCS